MSDLLYFDAAVIWSSGDGVKVTFHRFSSIGFSSLHYWRFSNCNCSLRSDSGFVRRLSCVEKCFLPNDEQDCGYWSFGSGSCKCVVRRNGLFYGEHGVCSRHDDRDLPF